jgi:hypothetical protein
MLPSLRGWLRSAQILDGAQLQRFTSWAAAFDPTKISGKEPAQVHNLGTNGTGVLGRNVAFRTSSFGTHCVDFKACYSLAVFKYAGFDPIFSG